MAEKRVSVRLAAVGGKQVRAELEGVGDAGARGFGRMSREAEAANAKLAAFATRVKIAAAVAVGAAVAAGVAMVKSGLETIDAQANLAQSLGTTTRSWPPRRPTRSQTCQPSWLSGWFSRAGHSGHAPSQPSQRSQAAQ